ncbi:MAG: VWA domain-containing protein [Lentisphaerales bacterium]|nr:VWA domain-containing protein [Lentisphaerales bacterium]
MNFETVFPQFLYYLIAILFIASLVATWKRYRNSLKPVYVSSILLTRFIALAFLVLFGLNPYSVDETPDYEAFGIGVLVDNSRSMDSEDCQGQSRLSVAQELVEAESGWVKKATSSFNVTYNTFAADVSGLPAEGKLLSQVGGTNIAQALENYSKVASRGSLGAVLLLTDGQENSGSAIELAKKFKSSGVPINVIAVGGQKELQDVELKFHNPLKRSSKKKEFELFVKVKKNTDTNLREEVILSSYGVELGRKLIDLPAGKGEELISFSLREFTAGFKNYRAAIAVSTQEMIKSNNVDYTAVDITDDNKIKILYFSGNLSWEYKYLDKLCDDSENLQLTALIRTGENAWYYYAGKEEKKFNVFPETTELIEYDVIICDLGAEYLLTEKIVGDIEKFAFDKGGGVLFLGRQKQESRFSGLMPVGKLMPKSTSGKKVMQLSENSMLVPRSRKDLTDLSQVLSVKGGKMFFASSVKDLKTSARFDLKLRGSSNNVILSSLYYGAGRTAYLGIETWPWKMNPDNDGEHYDVFWKRLLTWLSSASVKQLSVLPAYRKFAAGEAMDVGVDLLDPDFEPSLTADVEAILKSPSGKVTTLKLPSSLDLEGRFALDYIPVESGEYSLSINVKFADDSVLTDKVAFLAAEASGETGTLPLNDRLLKDVARITGGEYFSWQDTPLKELKLSSNVPVIQSRTYLFNSWWIMLIIISLLCLEWFLRRRIGLR